MVETEAAVEQSLKDDPNLLPMVEAEDMIVTRISFEMMPIIWITLSSDNGMTTAQVQTVAENLADHVLGVKGLLTEETPFMKTVTIEGGEENALVIPDVEGMDTLGVPISWMVSALQSKTE